MPNEIWYTILSFCEVTDLVRIGGTDKNLKNLTADLTQKKPFIVIKPSEDNYGFAHEVNLEKVLSDIPGLISVFVLAKLPNHLSDFNYEKFNNVSFLHIGHYKLNEKDMSMFSTMPQLKSLSLASSDLCENLSGQRLTMLTNLTSLNLAKTYNEEYPLNLLNSIIPDVTKLTNLRFLNLKKSNINVENIGELTSLTNLISLNLQDTGIKEDESLIHKLIEKLTNLTNLNVSDNNFDKLG